MILVALADNPPSYGMFAATNTQPMRTYGQVQETLLHGGLGGKWHLQFSVMTVAAILPG